MAVTLMRRGNRCRRDPPSAAKNKNDRAQREARVGQLHVWVGKEEVSHLESLELYRSDVARPLRFGTQALPDRLHDRLGALAGAAGHDDPRPVAR